ncbi:MAG TPA: nuclear transport factor 2 family protein [Amaricoccus sp.]|uniref:nuclear transport factor 2 family protein n=1 Tax=Amaricoccus sp. TaxID=1872485 RepID=UPI002CD718CA|nr:nuclear transport factor 2 family protein [Amaricoccus sp.]HMQ93471.1 nuclear transport factor 2 family protein [Amaricoccus sp.]HMR53668.1 nuclear transport factor 2 family protein [Amaricoccus sp.]HMU00734.1 nuclear transport factor 2 family protein [Amaricoccus sp.]
MQNTKTLIEARMKLYFDGLYHSDTERLGQVFAPGACYVCATGGEVINLGLDEYFPIVDRREPPAARGEPRRDEIVSIIMAGDRAALVVARCAIGERHFTDLLSFIDTAAGWRIIAKVFHYDLIPAPQPQE